MLKNQFKRRQKKESSYNRKNYDLLTFYLLDQVQRNYFYSMLNILQTVCFTSILAVIAFVQGFFRCFFFYVNVEKMFIYAKVLLMFRDDIGGFDAQTDFIYKVTCRIFGLGKMKELCNPSFTLNNLDMCFLSLIFFCLSKSFI